jgi:hypothetical protein
MPTYRNDSTASIYVESATGQTLVAPGGSVETYKILSDGWTKTADTPYPSIASASHEVEASAAGWESQAVSADTAVLDIYSSVDVVIHPQAQAASGYRLPAGQVVQIRVNGEIDVLHLDFQGVGTVVINELPE